MMPPSKNEVLADITLLAAQNKLTLQEVTNAFHHGVAAETPPTEQVAEASVTGESLRGHANTLTNTLYIIGALIICGSIIGLISENWYDMSPVVRIIVTLGLGLLTLAGGWWRELRAKTLNRDVLASSLFLISGVGIITGFYVLVDSVMGVTDSDAIRVLIGMIFATGFFSAVYFYFLRNVMVLAMAIIAGSVGYGALMNVLITDHTYEYFDDIYAYTIAILGAGLVVLGELFRTRRVASLLTPSLYAMGAVVTFMSLSTTLFNFGYDSNGVFNEVLYTVTVAACIAASVKLHSQQLLITGAFFLTTFMLYISGKYFADSLSWPITLLLMGAIIMGVAYTTKQLSDKYIK